MMSAIRKGRGVKKWSTLLKYGFCNKVISERWNSDQLTTFTTYLSSLLDLIAEYNSNHAQKWGQICCKSVQLVRVSSFRNNLLQNPYFNRLSLNNIKIFFSILLKFSLIRCQCNGHATHCAPTDETDDQDGPRDEITTMQCMCMHGTAGKNCETCLTDHWNRPWRRATSQQANECKRKFSPIRIFTWFTTWVLCRYRVSYGRVFLSRYLFATALL